jgi:hypothetical protein
MAKFELRIVEKLLVWLGDIDLLNDEDNGALFFLKMNSLPEWQKWEFFRG